MLLSWCLFTGKRSLGLKRSSDSQLLLFSSVKKPLVVDKNYLVVDKILGLESVQLQEVPEQGDVPILDCVMKNCLVAFYILFKNRAKNIKNPSQIRNVLQDNLEISHKPIRGNPGQLCSWWGASPSLQ